MPQWFSQSGKLEKNIGEEILILSYVVQPEIQGEHNSPREVCKFVKSCMNTDHGDVTHEIRVSWRDKVIYSYFKLISFDLNSDMKDLWKLMY